MTTPRLLVGPLILAALVITPALGAPPSDPDSTGLPGDHFSLQGALELFRNAASPEAFEQQLNTQENHVNNLDLNGDGEVDYLRVIDKTENNVHVLILQVPVSDKESQDIALIGIEKTGDTTAVAQIVGDAEIFGEETILEPGEGEEEEMEDAIEQEQPKGPHANPGHIRSSYPIRIVVNVWFWPAVRFIYAPRYVAWVSPWRWRVYPTWWHPWRPLAWRVFHPFRVRIVPGFAVARTHRIAAARKVYAPVRVSSVTVRTRHAGAMKSHKVTRTTRVRTGPHGTKVKTTRTTVKTKKRR